MTINKMLDNLKNENIKTWFDLGLFLDRLKDNRKIPSASFWGFFEDFRQSIKKGGIAFITFDYGVDGVSIEVCKYAECFKKIIKDVPLHFICGEFYPESKNLLSDYRYKYELPTLKAFNKWPLFNSFFMTKLERGSIEYNDLIKKFWNETLSIIENLGTYIEQNSINLLCIFNACSNPGNVSLTLAAVLISEYLGIPVISNNHDFYWEGGNREIDIKTKGLKRGPRDFFFTNSHIGEFFSIIEMLYPWESRSWLSVNINKNQSKHIIETNGHNPANVCEINTSVNIESYKNVSKQTKGKAISQIADILARYKKNINVHSPSKVLNEIITSKEKIEPVIIGEKDSNSFDFTDNNIIFLQPTRIMYRKRIEVDFDLIKKLFENSEFNEKFLQNTSLRLTLLVTGPMAQGQFNYFTKIVKKFEKLLEELSPEHKERVYLGFLFSEFDKRKFIDKYNYPLTIQEIYNIASLILLPSETEGRGLPIIESAASGIPIFVNRYQPKRVYDEVIGKHLEEKYRLKVLEFEKNKIGNNIIKSILTWIFFPQKFKNLIEHNQKVVELRYSINALENKIEKIFHRLYYQLKPNDFSMQRTIQVINEYKGLLNYNKEELKPLLNTEKRDYLPGYGRLSFMIFLKSLIDPSYFRMEEQQVRGPAMKFAKQLVADTGKYSKIKTEDIIHFYNSIDNIFIYHKGEIKMRHDHSMAYRHRNKRYYPYQDLTYQELTGLINLLFNKIFVPISKPVFSEIPNLFNNLSFALYQLTNSSYLSIDDREILIKRLHKNIPIALFPGEYIKYELDFFGVQHFRRILKLKYNDEITEEKLAKFKNKLEPVYVFATTKPMGKRMNAKSLKLYINKSKDRELKLLYEKSLIQIVKTKQWCVGIHLAQLGSKALIILKEIKDKNGILITCKPHAAMMTDIMNIDRFHIGSARNIMTAKILGIPQYTGFIQFAPSGVRTTLAYPTPIQTALDFSNALKSKSFKELSRKIGQEKLFNIIRTDAETARSPITTVLENLEKEKKSKNKYIEYSYVSGIYKDNHPYNGAVTHLKIHHSTKKWKFTTVTDINRKKVTDFIADYEKKNNHKIEVGWNGGYMLNPELVGKLGLPESYIGSPLGLIITNKEMLCPPLFNKPTFIIYPDGKLDIKRVNCQNGFTISDGKNSIVFSKENYNLSKPNNAPCYYDLLYPEDTIPGSGRTIIRLAGNIIKEIIETRQGENISFIPVGLVLSFSKDELPEEWKINKSLNFHIKELEGIENAIEAGPMLLEAGSVCIDMKLEGWKTDKSIKTQAARMDYIDMRGPKIAIGIGEKGDLSILCINGRIRESVGATHHDMAEILKNMGMKKAMGFDPGGSSTIYTSGKVLNISPFNSEYEKDVLSLPPEPRPVGNAILGWLE